MDLFYTNTVPNIQDKIINNLVIKDISKNDLIINNCTIENLIIKYCNFSNLKLKANIHKLTIESTQIKNSTFDIRSASLKNNIIEIKKSLLEDTYIKHNLSNRIHFESCELKKLIFDSHETKVDSIYDLYNCQVENMLFKNKNHITIIAVNNHFYKDFIIDSDLIEIELISSDNTVYTNPKYNNKVLKNSNVLFKIVEDSDLTKL